MQDIDGVTTKMLLHSIELSRKILTTCSHEGHALSLMMVMCCIVFPKFDIINLDDEVESIKSKIKTKLVNM